MNTPQLTFTPLELPNDEVISVAECKRFIGKFNLEEARVEEIRNNMIGLINSILNTYIDNFE